MKNRPGSSLPAGRNYGGNRFEKAAPAKAKGKAKPKPGAKKKAAPPLPPQAFALAAAMKSAK